MSNEREATPEVADAGANEQTKNAVDEREPGVGEGVGANAQGPAAKPDSEGEPAPAQEPERSPGELARLLQEAQRKAEQYWEKVLRLQAEQENLRKRAARDVENAHKYALERFLSELLPVRDSLELGVAAANDEAAEVSHVREGVGLTLKMLDGALEKFGVQEINPINEPFDPQYHQAMSVQAAEGKPSGTVINVVQKGCLLNGRVVRPAMVIVSK